MSIDVARSCGHAQSQDVSGKKPFEVESLTKFLAGKPCKACDPKVAARRDKFIADARARELAAARELEGQLGFEALTGPPKMVGWATTVRIDMVQRAWAHLEIDETAFSQRIGDRAGQVTSASWWIDHRQDDVALLEGVLIDALGEPEQARDNENPY